jgi:hypothetical protein
VARGRLDGCASTACASAEPYGAMAAAARATKLREVYASAGQGHVFKFFDTLSASDQVPGFPLTCMPAAAVSCELLSAAREGGKEMPRALKN